MAINKEHESIRVGLETLEILLHVLSRTTEFSAFFRSQAGYSVRVGHINPSVVDDAFSARCEFEDYISAALKRVEQADMAENSSAYNYQSEQLIAFLNEAFEGGRNHLVWEAYYDENAV